MDLPATFGDLRLLATIGSGAHGTIYRAQVLGDLGFVREVAVKLIDPVRLRETPHLAAALADEAAFLSRIDHRGVVRVQQLRRVDMGGAGHTYAMVMELVRGATVRDMQRSAVADELAVFPLSAVLQILADAADALEHLHGVRCDDGAHLGLVHRDLKPTNLMVDRRGRLKVLDLGIAWAHDRRATATVDSVRKGTPIYMSPEQLRGEPLDGRCDLYALGLIAFELLTGSHFVPLDEECCKDLVSMVHRTASTTLEERTPVLDRALGRRHGLDPAQSSALRRLILGLLAADVDERLADGAAVARAVDEAAKQLGVKPGRGWLRERATRPSELGPTDVRTTRMMALGRLHETTERLGTPDESVELELDDEAPPTPRLIPRPPARLVLGALSIGLTLALSGMVLAAAATVHRATSTPPAEEPSSTDSSASVVPVAAPDPTSLSLAAEPAVGQVPEVAPSPRRSRASSPMPAAEPSPTPDRSSPARSGSSREAERPATAQEVVTEPAPRRPEVVGRTDEPVRAEPPRPAGQWGMTRVAHEIDRSAGGRTRVEVVVEGPARGVRATLHWRLAGGRWRNVEMGMLEKAGTFRKVVSFPDGSVPDQLEYYVEVVEERSGGGVTTRVRHADGQRRRPHVARLASAR